ncbi:Actin-histidine N-methyltransferase [Coccomyxa sp. Obi]|nr:Actin-histidine N-methyltransferase [Coccomyxa sp. Obi]
MQSLLFRVSVACDGSSSANRGGLCSPCRQHAVVEVRRSCRCAAQAQAVETLPPLSAWIEQRGLPLRKLHVRPEEVEGELSLVVSQPTKKGQPLVAVPSSAWLTQQDVRTSSIGPLVKDLDAWLQIALFLLHERSQPDAAWQGFLDSIPAQPDVPLFWSEEELAQLEGTQLLSSVQGYRQFFEAKFAELEEQLFMPHPDVFPPEVYALDGFLWAVATVRSRVHSPLDGEDVALVPLADLVRHRKVEGAKWVLQLAGGLFSKAQALVVEAERDYAEGEVVTMDYGAPLTEADERKLDSQVLLDYGVLDTNGAQGGFVLSLELPEDDKYYDDKADILELNGLSEAASFVLRPNEEPSEQLLGFLRLINLSGQDCFLLEPLFRNEAWGHMLAPMSEANERSVYVSMMEGCRAALQGYSTTIDDDLRALRDAPPGSRLEKAILVRLGEKQTLDAVLGFFEERFDRIASLEFYQERRLKRLGLLDDDGRTTYDSFFSDGIA